MEFEGKQHAVANLIAGGPVDDTDRVAVCIKGHINGCESRLEAFMTGWPFGVTYIVQSTPGDLRHESDAGSKITLLPRIGRGAWSFFSHILLFEAKGMNVHDRRLEKQIIFSYDNQEEALRLIKYPGIADILLTLESDCKLKEMIIKTTAGICFTQGVNFKELDLDMCSATFNYLAQIAQVMSEIFASPTDAR